MHTGRERCCRCCAGGGAGCAAAGAAPEGQLGLDACSHAWHTALFCGFEEGRSCEELLGAWAPKPALGCVQPNQTCPAAPPCVLCLTTWLPNDRYVGPRTPQPQAGHQSDVVVQQRLPAHLVCALSASPSSHTEQMVTGYVLVVSDSSGLARSLAVCCLRWLCLLEIKDCCALDLLSFWCWQS